MNILENTLDWIADGVALLRADDRIVYGNDMLRELARRGDGLRIIGDSIAFAELEARRRFTAALGAAQRTGDGSHDMQSMDFAAPRMGGMPAYIVSVRPLVKFDALSVHHAHAEILVFIRDPLWRNAATSHILQNLFGLTNAEAHLAQALCTGTTTISYAAARGVSLNTVYSHLKRIREKTGCKSVPELIAKFGEFDVPLRLK